MKTAKELLASALVFAALNLSHIAAAKTIDVHIGADHGPGSLRQALLQVSNGDTINVDVKQGIILTSGELVVDKNLKIHGNGGHGMISGNNTSRVFHITPGLSVTLDSLTITNGAASIELDNFPENAGGGIYSDHANLTLKNCLVTNNVARFGAGIFSSSKDGGNATLTINDSTISNNSAREVLGYIGAYGAGIFSGGGFVNMSQAGNAALTLTNSTISNNSAESQGGAIFNDGFGGDSTVAITNSIINANTAFESGGGISNNGDSGNALLTLTKCTLSGNSAFLFGGAIYNNAFSATLPLGALIFGPVTGESAGGSAVDYQVNFTGGQGYIITEMAQPANPTENFDAIIAIIDPNGQTIVDQDTYVDETVTFVAPATGRYTVRVHPFFLDGVPTFGQFTFQVNAALERSADVTLSNCTLQGNSSNSEGGAIYSYTLRGVSTVTLAKTSLTGNYVGELGSGGAIFVRQQKDDTGFGAAGLTMSSCEVKNNFAGEDGGGIEVNGVTFDATNTLVTGNSVRSDSFFGGGGIAVNVFVSLPVKATLTNCNVSNNSAATGGGISSFSELHLVKCTVSGNSATTDGGGIFSAAGLYNDSTLELRNSTVSGNVAGIQGQEGFGGGIFNVGASLTSTVILVNSTLSGNSATTFGGGIDNAGIYGGAGVVTVMNSTLSGNSAETGGGIFTETFEGGNATVDLSNTIINAGASGSNFYVDSGTITSLGYNLSSDAAGGDSRKAPGGLLNGPGDIRNTNPMLGPLKDNGGPTMTHALMNKSAAIDAGDPNFNPYLFDPPLLYDQRGPNNPRIFKGRVDIGAYEEH